MNSPQFLRIKPLSRKNHIFVAAKHNLREIQSELGAGAHIDSTRSKDNQILLGENSASGVKDYAQALMQEAGVISLRKNAVRGIEFIFSLPPKSGIDEAAFFRDSLEWVKAPFPAPILSAVIHRDEAAPHMHVLLLPLLHGRMQGSKLMGDKTRITALQTDFHMLVGAKYGMVRNRRKFRLSHHDSQKAAQLAVHTLIDNPEFLLRSDVASAVIHGISKDPEPLLVALGIPIPVTVRRGSSFVEIMTKPCKPERKYWESAKESTNPITV
jgi:hypothetical protein